MATPELELKPPPDITTETPEETKAKGDILQLGKEKVTLAKGYEESVKQRAGELEAALNKPKPVAPEVPDYPKPPSQKIRPFAENTPGEPWQITANKAMMSMGLLAQAVGGLVTKYPQGALAAMQGAYEGWQQGDKERGDREFKQWGALTEQMKDKFEQDRQHFQDLWNNWQGDVESLKAKLAVEGVKMGASEKAIEAMQQNPETILKWLDDRKKLSLESWQMWNELAAKREAQKFREEMLKETQRAHLEAEQARRDALEERTREFNERMTEKAKALGAKNQKETQSLGRFDMTMTKLRTLIPALEAKGYIAKENNPVALGRAWAKRKAYPGDPDLQKFHQLQTIIIGLERGVFDDKGLRAQSAYGAALEFFNSPTTGGAGLAVVDQWQDFIDEQRQERGGGKPSGPVDVGTPEAVTPGGFAGTAGWSIKEIK